MPKFASIVSNAQKIAVRTLHTHKLTSANTQYVSRGVFMQTICLPVFVGIGVAALNAYTGSKQPQKSAVDRLSDNNSVKTIGK